MFRSCVWIFAVAVASIAFAPGVVRGQTKDDKAEVVKAEIEKAETTKPADFKPEQQASKGSVTIGGVAIPYDAYAGTIIVHPKGYDDVPQNRDPNDKSLQPHLQQIGQLVTSFFGGRGVARRRLGLRTGTGS